MGHSVTLLVEALRYKPEGSGFDGVIGIFFDVIIPAPLGPGYSSVFNLQAPCVLYIGQTFRYSPENVFIYLINKYISLSDICLTVHH